MDLFTFHDTSCGKADVSWRHRKLLRVPFNLLPVFQLHINLIENKKLLTADWNRAQNLGRVVPYLKYDLLRKNVFT